MKPAHHPQPRVAPPQRGHTAAEAEPGPPPDLAHWLNRCATLSPEYGGMLSTHLPMALQALHALGASAARLNAMFNQVAPRIPPRAAPASAILPETGWVAQLGHYPAFEALHATFADHAQRRGVNALLAMALPTLLPGVSAAAFHGLIRTAHGVAAGHTGEVVAGLAYWAARHQPLPASDDPAWRSTADWLTALQALPAPGGPPLPMITQRMRAWAQMPGFQAVAPSLALGPHTLATLAQAAAALYAASGHFTVLHAVTACQALGVLRPWLPADPSALRPVVVALAAALASTGLPRLQAALPDAAPPWSATVAHALASDDEHVIKLVRACQALAAEDSQPVYAAAAARAVGQWPVPS